MTLSHDDSIGNIVRVIIRYVAIQSIERKRFLVQTCRQSHVSVGLSGGCTVTKRLIGSGYHLG